LRIADGTTDVKSARGNDPLAKVRHLSLTPSWPYCAAGRGSRET
jgi:hypothetical protein